MFSPKRESSFALLCALQSHSEVIVFSELSLQFKAPGEPSSALYTFLLITISFCPIHSLAYSQKGQRGIFIAVKNCLAEGRSELWRNMNDSEDQSQFPLVCNQSVYSHFCTSDGHKYEKNQVNLLIYSHVIQFISETQLEHAGASPFFPGCSLQSTKAGAAAPETQVSIPAAVGAPCPCPCCVQVDQVSGRRVCTTGGFGTADTAGQPARGGQVAEERAWFPSWTEGPDQPTLLPSPRLFMCGAKSPTSRAVSGPSGRSS